VNTKQSVQRLYCGAFCAQRVVHFHDIFHFIFNSVYQQLVRISKREDYLKFPLGKKRRKAMVKKLSEGYLKKQYLTLKELISNAESFGNNQGPWYEQGKNLRRKTK